MYSDLRMSGRAVMTDEATLWTEEKLTTLIGKIITRALDEHVQYYKR